MLMTHTQNARGFTIIELVIVVILIAILALTTVSYFGSSASNSAKAHSVFESSNKLIKNFQILSAAANATNSIASSPLPLSGKTAVDVMIEGQTSLKDEYKRYWIELDLHPMSEVIYRDSSGRYFIEKFEFVMSGGGSIPNQIQFLNMPDSIVLTMVSKYINPTVQLNDAGDTTSPSIHYGIKTSTDTRSLTILKR